MTAFHEVQFPADISHGAAGGPEFATSVIVTAAGFESRNIGWAEPRGRWNVAHGLKRREQMAALIAFFRARRGRAHGFRFKDWSDYQAVDQNLGTGDGVATEFQLVKRYESGGIERLRRIAKPVAGTIKLYLDGVEQMSGWSVDAATGLVTFEAPPAGGVAVTADFEFDVPARFDTDVMELSLETYQLGRWTEIPVMELRL